MPTGPKKNPTEPKPVPQFSAHQAEQVKQHIRLKAFEFGFDLVGFAPVLPSENAAYVRRFIDEGRHGEMNYLPERLEERLDTEKYFGGVRTAVCVARFYDPNPKHSSGAEAFESHSGAAVPGKIARYAQGQDYHRLIKDNLHDLADWLRATHPGTHTKCGVDTVPVLERELAARSGIGWVGKNTMLISPHAGSYFFLGEMLTNLDLPPDPPEPDRCGSCTRCIDACPTQAIVSPYELDPRLCISYLTIEQTKPIAPELAQKLSGWLAGCDICQEVCPWNARAPELVRSIEPPEQPFAPKYPGGQLDAAQVANWTQEQWMLATRRSALRRVSLDQFKRNAQVLIQQNTAN